MCLAWQYGQLDLRGHLNPQHTPTLSTLLIVDFYPGHKMTKIPLNVKFQLNSFLPCMHNSITRDQKLNRNGLLDNKVHSTNFIPEFNPNCSASKLDSLHSTTFDRKLLNDICAFALCILFLPLCCDWSSGSLADH